MSADDTQDLAASYERLLARRGRPNEAKKLKLLAWAYAMLPPSALTDPRAREIADVLADEWSAVYPKQEGTGT